MIILNDISIEGNNYKVVRDDVFPEVGGGNKARKMVEYEKDIRKHGANAVVTTGGIQSNHCRAVAIMAAKNNWRCHIVYHGTKERFDRENGNALLVRMTGATRQFVDVNDISSAMDNAMLLYREKGLNPYYITGGGHDIPGGIAYVNAVFELKKELQRINWIPDYIFLASGTGSTQSGIIVGSFLSGWNKTKIIGISVARKKDRGMSVIIEFTNRLCCNYGIKDDLSSKVIFCDDYLLGGYEGTNDFVKSFLNRVTKSTGIFLDTTYSGKAFYGMCDLVKNGGLTGNILFWHTGGIMNIQK